MRNFLIKINSACDELNNLSLGSKTSETKRTYLVNNREVKIILDKYFSNYNEIENHLKNYFKLVTKARRLAPLEDGKYWIYRSAIASLSKYINPNVVMLMTQYYDDALDIFDESINKMTDNTDEIQVNIANSFNIIIKSATVRFGYVGDLKNKEKCVEILKSALDDALNKLKKQKIIESYIIFKSISNSVLEAMISNIHPTPDEIS